MSGRALQFHVATMTCKGAAEANQMSIKACRRRSGSIKRIEPVKRVERDAEGFSVGR
jgi:hypothetical protein